MRARELRDVIEVLIVPSLDRAVRELVDKRGSRRKARLLVQQSLDQLRGMMAEPVEPAPSGRRKPSAKGSVADFEVVNPADDPKSVPTGDGGSAPPPPGELIADPRGPGEVPEPPGELIGDPPAGADDFRHDER